MKKWKDASGWEPGEPTKLLKRKSMKTHLFDDPKWLCEKLTGKKKISAADYKYFTHNGPIEKAFYGLCKLIGNGYRGPK